MGVSCAQAAAVGYYPFGNMNTPLMKSIFDNWSTDYGFGYDFTAYFTMYAKLYLLEVERLAEAVDYLQELNDLMEGAFDFPMNNRQKSILSSACRAPDSGMRIGPHQRTFRVAYATARADFLKPNAVAVWCASRWARPLCSKHLTDCGQKSIRWAMNYWLRKNLK